MNPFDVDAFVERCRRAAARESEPMQAVREILDEALTDPAAIHAALPADRAELSPLYMGQDLTITKVVWAPHMAFPPHDHLTWACIGIYGGSEHNTLYRLEDGALQRVDEFLIDECGTGAMDAEAIHAVRNPDARRLSAALHVYGGHFPSLPRSNWVGDPPTRVAADLEATRKIFEHANADRPDAGWH